MSRPAAGGQIRPRGGGGSGDMLWWLVPIGLGLVAAASTAALVGGWLASGLSGHGFTARRGWRLLGVADLAEHDQAWPGAPAGLVWTLAIALFAAVAAAVITAAVLLWKASRRTQSSPARSMATRRDIDRLHTNTVAASALRLRPALAGNGMKAKQLPRTQRGVTCGLHLPSRALIQATWEDVLLVIAPPRCGKTTAFAVPTVLDAPGAVVACSNKPDLYMATAELRVGATGGRCWVFDPQRIAHVDQQWWWNPIGGRITLDDATRLAGGFILAVADDNNREIWGPAAGELLSNLILAAHLHSDPRSRHLLTVYQWLYDEATDEPVRILRSRGHAAAADSLTGLQGLPTETRGSVYFTARAGCASLRDNEISRWITPQPGLEEFSPSRFVTTADTLYLMSKGVKGGTSAAAIVAALTTELRVAAERAGERRGGRIDPPLLLVLDEVANICRIADLPEQYSHLGSRSIVVMAILQSYAQGERVWGKAGMKELWGAATIKTVGSGVDDGEFAEEMSKLIGDHDVSVLSYNRGRGGGGSSTSTRRERIMSAADIRAMPRNHAILLATAMRPAMIELLPWYDGLRRREITAALERAEAELIGRVERGGDAA